MKSFQTCCLCCKLETGAYVVGTLGLLGSFLLIMAELFVATSDIPNNFPELPTAFAIIWGITSGIAFILLVVGTYKRNSRMILSYLIIGFIDSILLTIQYIILLTKSNTDANLPEYIIFPISLLVDIYGWLCMYSLYIKIKNEQTYTKNEFVYNA